MQSFISFIKYLETSNAINFILMVLFLGWIFKKINLSGLFLSGIDNTKSQISVSENEKDSAAKEFYDVRVEADSLPEKLASINKDAMDSAGVVCKNIENDANRTVDMIKDNILKTVSNEEKYLSSKITSETVSKVVNKVREDVLASLNKEPSLQNEFVERSLEEFERVNV